MRWTWSPCQILGAMKNYTGLWRLFTEAMDNAQGRTVSNGETDRGSSIFGKYSQKMSKSGAKWWTDGKHLGRNVARPVEEPGLDRNTWATAPSLLHGQPREVAWQAKKEVGCDGMERRRHGLGSKAGQWQEHGGGRWFSKVSESWYLKNIASSIEERIRIYGERLRHQKWKWRRGKGEKKTTMTEKPGCKREREREIRFIALEAQIYFNKIMVRLSNNHDMHVT